MRGALTLDNENVSAALLLSFAPRKLLILQGRTGISGRSQFRGKDWKLPFCGGSVRFFMVACGSRIFGNENLKLLGNQAKYILKLGELLRQLTAPEGRV
jgi:hypothetical protein